MIEPKKYLSQLLYIDADINSRQVELEQVRDDLISIPATQYKNDSVQEGLSTYDDRYTRLFELSEYISAKIDVLHDLREEATKKIDRCSKPEYMIILRERYINGKHWDEIALEMNVTRRHVTRLHGQALKDFAENN